MNVEKYTYLVTLFIISKILNYSQSPQVISHLDEVRYF